jgi:hypothetical protein
MMMWHSMHDDVTQYAWWCDTSDAANSTHLAYIWHIRYLSTHLTYIWHIRYLSTHLTYIWHIRYLSTHLTYIWHIRYLSTHLTPAAHSLHTSHTSDTYIWHTQQHTRSRTMTKQRKKENEYYSLSFICMMMWHSTYSLSFYAWWRDIVHTLSRKSTTLSLSHTHIHTCTRARSHTHTHTVKWWHKQGLPWCGLYDLRTVYLSGMYDDVTQYVWWCDILHSVWPTNSVPIGYVWWCDTVCMMMWHTA